MVVPRVSRGSTAAKPCGHSISVNKYSVGSNAFERSTSIWHWYRITALPRKCLSCTTWLLAEAGSHCHNDSTTNTPIKYDMSNGHKQDLMLILSLGYNLTRPRLFVAPRCHKKYLPVPSSSQESLQFKRPDTCGIPGGSSRLSEFLVAWEWRFSSVPVGDDDSTKRTITFISTTESCKIYLDYMHSLSLMAVWEGVSWRQRHNLQAASSFFPWRRLLANCIHAEASVKEHKNWPRNCKRIRLRFPACHAHGQHADICVVLRLAK
jgi:hypothetical protein